MNANPGPTSLHALARLLVESWNQIDGRAFARLFTPDAEYVTGAGERISGHQEISQLVKRAAPAAQVALAEEPSAECDVRRGELTFAWSAMEPSGVARHGTITCSCVRHGDGWLIESLRNNEDSAGEARAAQQGDEADEA